MTACVRCCRRRRRRQQREVEQRRWGARGEGGRIQAGGEIIDGGALRTRAGSTEERALGFPGPSDSHAASRCAPPGPDSKFVLFWPEEVGEAWVALRAAGEAPRGFMYWTIAEEGATPPGTERELWFTRELVHAMDLPARAIAPKR